MNIGVFLILNRQGSLEENLALARDAGFSHADLTYTHSGAAMMERSGLIPSVSLDANPFDIKRLFEKYGIGISTVCAHAPLLEASSPARFGAAEIMKAVRFAAAIGVRDVITTEFYANSEWSRRLTHEQRVCVAAEKLYEASRMAADYGVKICLEPHGPLTCSIRGLGDILDLLGNPDSVGVNLDTGNCWLGGADPVEMATVFKDRIYHIHWKDLGEEYAAKRGAIFGSGFSTIELGTGVIDLEGVADALRDSPIIHNSTLEISGPPELLRASAAHAKKLWERTQKL
ncbi:MAG: sugar phosphate isomerase/epimerase [Candidatus Accumulibacter sp.]|jgi:inosose dehydratase|nr:sugar phosphate isomerase/epimerase [Accumulibacter sp.]